MNNLKNVSYSNQIATCVVFTAFPVVPKFKTVVEKYS